MCLLGNERLCRGLRLEQGGTRPPAQPQALFDFDLVDLTQINGSRERLEGNIPERYGTAEGDVAQGNRAITSTIWPLGWTC